MKTKIFKEIIFWLSYIVIIYLILMIGQKSLNPLKWGYVNYDDIHGISISIRLVGIFISLCILILFLSLINQVKNK